MNVAASSARPWQTGDLADEAHGIPSLEHPEASRTRAKASMCHISSKMNAAG